MPAGTVTTLRATLALELRLHGRDFMAWLGVLVFFWLAFAHASGGPIALVSGPLAALPRTATPVLAQAMAGLTAFGQVITAMTAATIALRDVALRSEGITLTTGIGWRSYLLGRFAATLAVLLAIYLAMPLGFAAGAWVAALRGAAAMPEASALLMPLGALVLPNIVLVAAAFFAAGVLSGGFVVILFVGLGFIGLWQSGLAMAARGDTLGALVDPFGNAALTLGVGLAANRLLWLGMAMLLLGLTLWRWTPVAAGRRPRETPQATTQPAARGSGLDALRGASSREVWRSEFRFGWQWVLRERGFLVLLGLASLNAIANGWALADDATALVRALEFHARLFGILIATIYAGELVWRDRDVRADALFAALPVSADLRLVSRAAGVLVALWLLPVATAGAALLLPVLRGATPQAACAVGWLAGVGGLAFSALFGLSLLVHRLVQHKTGAHLLMIAAWVIAIAGGADALALPWQSWGRCTP